MIRLDNYKRIHNRVMRGFIQDGFVISDGVTFSEPLDGHITVRGEIRCQGGFQIDVDKKLRIVSGTGATTRVKTVEYSYNVSVAGRGNVFRYDSAHNHRQHHHVHRFDARGDLVSLHDIHDENEVPTLGDVIAEARELYYSPELSEDSEES